MRILAFAASQREGSYNKKLIRLAAEAARRRGAEVDLADFALFDMPLYNGDVEAGSGFPAGAQELKRRLDAADAFMIASPEYNWSIPGTLKNAIDWVSRMKPTPFRGKVGLLLAASTGPVGGARVLLALRAPFDCNGAILVPGSFSLPHAQNVFDAEGKLTDEALQKRLEGAVESFLKTAGALVA